MQHDEVIWQVIGHHSCSFRSKMQIQNFCRNENNVTGLCNRSSCPLSNSRYATVREHDGLLYLYMKTIERSHSPLNLWERIKLPRNYDKALEIIDKQLEFWPKFLVHKNKQRLTKMTQYLIRMRKLALKVKPKLVTVPAKQVQRERRREAKAQVAAVIDRSIEKELLQRLQSGTYGDIYNFPVKEYEKVLAMEEMEAADEEEDEEEEKEPEIEYVEGYEMEDEDDIEDFKLGMQMDDSEDSEFKIGLRMDDSEDSEPEEEIANKSSRKKDKGSSAKRDTKRWDDKASSKTAPKRRRKGEHVEIEYEQEQELQT